MRGARKILTAKRGASRLPLIVALVFIALAAGAGWYFWTKSRSVETVKVERGTVIRAFYATGVVRPDYEYVIKSKAQGALVGFERREGARVSRGQLLGRVDDKQLAYEVERTTAELKEAQKQAADDAPQRTEVQARLNEAKMQAAIAKESLDRTQASYERRAATSTDLDNARRTSVQWDNTVSALEGQLGTWRISSQRAVDVAEANRRKAKANLADAQVLSPIDGVILERYVEDQEVVGINQKLLLIAAPEDKVMRAAVDEEDVTRCSPGQKVEMQLYAFQDRDGLGTPLILEGKVREILPSANLTNKTYEVKVEFVNPPEGLRVGMTGELNFIESESGRKQALIVPSSAVLDRKVYRAKESALGGGYAAVPVKLGVRTLDKVEILEGISEGDVIVKDAKQVAPVKLPPQQQPVVPTRTGDNETAGAVP